MVDRGRAHGRAAAADAYTERVEYPLAVVTTTADDGTRSGCLVGFLTQCSIEPPRFLVCISKVNHTFEVLDRAEVVALHLLGADQDDTASLFGETTGDRVDKFDHVAWHQGPRGVPVLDDCAAWLALAVVDRIDVGDHVAVVTRPIGGGPGTGGGLLTSASAPPLAAGHPVA